MVAGDNTMVEEDGRFCIVGIERARLSRCNYCVNALSPSPHLAFPSLANQNPARTSPLGVAQSGNQIFVTHSAVRWPCESRPGLHCCCFDSEILMTFAFVRLLVSLVATTSDPSPGFCLAFVTRACINRYPEIDSRRMRITPALSLHLFTIYTHDGKQARKQQITFLLRSIY